MNEWFSLAHEIGWRSKGVPVHEPLYGVPVHVRAAIEVILGSDRARASATDAGSLHGRRWASPAFDGLGPLHPMTGDPGRLVERFLLPYIEARVDQPGRLDISTPDRWQFDGHSVPVNLLDIEAQVRSGADQLYPRTQEAIAVGLIRTWSLAWLERLGQARIHESDEPLRVVLRGNHVFPALALLDTIDLIEATRRAYGYGGGQRRVILHAPDLDDSAERALSAYAQGRGDGLTDEAGPEPVARLARVDRANVQSPDVAIGGYAELTDAEALVEWTPHDVMRDALAATATVGRSVPQTYRISDVSHEVLDFFFQRLFPHARLRDHQVEACTRLLEGDSLLVLLPTGYGKSAIFQFVALMQPGVALVVSPLRSLILDQMRHLERVGIATGGYLLSGGPKRTDRGALERLEAGHLRLLYLTPERLEQTSFRRDLAEWLKRRRFSLIAVDEVHCVSEWGHDFRTAYQQLRPLRRFMNQHGLADIPIAGFTATASAIVRSDAARMLGIPSEHIVQSRSSDRPELSFSVHAVDGRSGPEERLRAVATVLTTVPSRVLGMHDGLTARHDNGRFTAGAIVFTPFAAANQEAFFSNKAPAVASFLAEAAFTDADVGTHATSAPSLCAACGSAMIKQHFKVFHCVRCGWSGERNALRRPSDWDECLLTTQDAFLGDQLPVLVSTKGFGMGVDKPNIRLIVHNVMSGSLEGYYQEAGRAGRDRQHAHVALVTVPPAQECAQEYLDSGSLFTLAADDPIPLPCLRKNHRGFPALRCPYGLQELCDVAQQAYLIDSNFPGASVARQDLQRTYGQALGGEFRVRSFEASRTSSALARLQTLTVIERRSSTWSANETTFKTSLPATWSWDEACEAVAAELRSFEQSMPSGHVAASGPADRLLALRGQGSTPDAFVALAGAVLVDVIYTVVRASRLVGLYNLHRYSTLPEGECRRVYLRRAFDVQPLTEAYRCGFCDNCVPDLVFDRVAAFVPVEQTRAQTLGERLAEVVQQYDRDALVAFAHDAYPDYADAVRVRCEQLLEQAPNDPALLFLASSSAAVQGSVNLARSLARRADAALARASAPHIERLRLVYALSEWDPGMAPALIGEIGGAFQNGAIPRAGLVGALREIDAALADRLMTSYALEHLVAGAHGVRDRLPRAYLQRLQSDGRRALERRG